MPIGTTSSASGQYALDFTLPKDSFPVTVQFSHVAFDDFSSSIDKNFNRSLDIKLTPKIQNLRVANVYSGPTRIASPYFSQILDYEISNGNIVLLEKLDKGRQNRVRIVDFQGNLLGEKIVKGKAVSLFKDCREEVYVIMYDRYLKVNHDIEVTVTRCTQNLENRINHPCRIITDSFLIYEEYGYAKLLSWFLKRKFNARYSSLFYYSADRTTMRLIQEDLLELRNKYGNVIQDLMYLEASLDNNPETRIQNLVMEEDLSESLFYKPNYCPLFLDNGNIIAFDHGSAQIVSMGLNGKVNRTQRIKYQKKLAWEPQVLFDQEKHKYFTVMKRGGWITLYSVDLQTGIASSYHKIENIFPEKIKVYNGYLLYLFRKPATPDRYSLYLEQY